MSEYQYYLKVPRDLIDVDTVQLYSGECVNIYPYAQDVILDFTSQDESGEYDEYIETGESVMASLLPLREDIMRGDLRAFYLGPAGAYEQICAAAHICSYAEFRNMRSISE